MNNVCEESVALSFEFRFEGTGKLFYEETRNDLN